MDFRRRQRHPGAGLGSVAATQSAFDGRRRACGRLGANGGVVGGLRRRRLVSGDVPGSFCASARTLRWSGHYRTRGCGAVVTIVVLMVMLLPWPGGGLWRAVFLTVRDYQIPALRQLLELSQFQANIATPGAGEHVLPRRGHARSFAFSNAMR